MAGAIDDLTETLEMLTASGYRGRILDRGLARGLIWEDGEVPEDSPPFAASLTDDLLDYAYAILELALELRGLAPNSGILPKSFLTAGEAIESAIHRGEHNPDEGFHRVSAAVAFHLARYSARAYSILKDAPSSLNLSPSETAVFFLLRRKFDQLHELFSSRLLDEENRDERIAKRLKNNDDYESSDAIHDVILNAFMSAIALFHHAISTGSINSGQAARNKMFHVAQSASDLNSVSHWWTSTLAAHLIDELWDLSFYSKLPPLPPDDPAQERWSRLRLNFIQRLFASSRSSIELWPSQLEAARRSVDPDDDLVVALPTSAGKTRIAELCILRTLAREERVVYVTPLRALSAQIERDLAETFVPLGFRVSSLYGSAGVEAEDSKKLRTEDIVVATPEKLDFALRNDANIINDVGLIVFDEGHMLGKGEREVRYETLVQRILKRDDCENRRIVCLSALFPSPEEMSDLVEWIRQDHEGSPVHSVWRPTRQRFGIIKKTRTGHGRLEITLGEEKPFVPGFVEPVAPPEDGRRKNLFPQDKNEMTISSAWRFVGQGRKVLIYCPIKKSVETLGKLVLKLLSQGVIFPLVADSEALREARNVGQEWLGKDHPAVKCLKFGVAIHHGSLPRQFLSEVEQLLRSGECLLTIASPTLAQGLNLSASVLLAASIWRNGDVVPSSEFANVAGRAGRAFVDLEGLVLHCVWEDSEFREKKAITTWESLVEEAKGAKLTSGILELALGLIVRISATTGIPWTEVIEYISGNITAWNFIAQEDDNITESDWERDLASLDAVLLGTLDPETPAETLSDTLRETMSGSLFSRQLSSHTENEIPPEAIFGLLTARATRIWSTTEANQRKGFYSAGIGLSAGVRLHEQIEFLVQLLIEIESGITSGDEPSVTEAVSKFAGIVFEFAPFQPFKGLPDSWEAMLTDWMLGKNAAEVINDSGSVGVDFLQDAVCYRLPWAMEAVRVHASSIGLGAAESLTGLGPRAVEAGSTNESAIVLIGSGLGSREAARIAVKDTSASFFDHDSMLTWLRADRVERRTANPDWPSGITRNSWIRFYEQRHKAKLSAWKRKMFSIGAQWAPEANLKEREVVLGPPLRNRGNRILSPDYQFLGETEYEISLGDLVSVWINPAKDGLFLEYFGPTVN